MQSQVNCIELREWLRTLMKKRKDAGYPKHVIKNTIKKFIRKKDEPLIPLWMFDERKHFTIRLPFSSKIEKYNAYFINKLVSFISGKVTFNVVWKIRKNSVVFPIKR